MMTPRSVEQVTGPLSKGRRKAVRSGRVRPRPETGEHERRPVEAVNAESLPRGFLTLAGPVGRNRTAAMAPPGLIGEYLPHVPHQRGRDLP